MSDILYVRYYERLDDAREMITKKYYDLCADEYEPSIPVYTDDKIGPVWSCSAFLDDIESAANKK